jgi:hypothetical protein
MENTTQVVRQNKRAAGLAYPVVVSVSRGPRLGDTDLRAFDVEVEWRGRRYVTRALTRTERGKPVGHLTCCATRPVGSTRVARWAISVVVKRVVEQTAVSVERAYPGAEWRCGWLYSDRALLPTEGDLRHDEHGWVDGAVDPTVWRQFKPRAEALAA